MKKIGIKLFILLTFFVGSFSVNSNVVNANSPTMLLFHSMNPQRFIAYLNHISKRASTEKEKMISLGFLTILKNYL